MEGERTRAVVPGGDLFGGGPEETAAATAAPASLLAAAAAAVGGVADHKSVEGAGADVLPGSHAVSSSSSSALSSECGEWPPGGDAEMAAAFAQSSSGGEDVAPEMYREPG